MTHVVAEPCIKCKYTDCVAVCPVECFHEGVNFLVINPEKCINCGMCVDVCPTAAIFTEDDLPEKWAEYVEINARYASQWPIIAQQKAPLPEAGEFRDVEDKRDLLDPAPFEPRKSSA